MKAIEQMFVSQASFLYVWVLPLPKGERASEKKWPGLLHPGPGYYFFFAAFLTFFTAFFTAFLTFFLAAIVITSFF